MSAKLQVPTSKIQGSSKHKRTKHKTPNNKAIELPQVTTQGGRARYCVPKSPAQQPRQAIACPTRRRSSKFRPPSSKEDPNTKKPNTKNQKNKAVELPQVTTQGGRARYCVPKAPAQHPRQAIACPTRRRSSKFRPPSSKEVPNTKKPNTKHQKNKAIELPQVTSDR